MTLGVFQTVTYKTHDTDGRRRRVLGFQIGRFAFRKTNEFDPYIRVETFYSVDHIVSGVRMLSVETVEEAAQVADDLSRFSRSDPSSADPGGLAKQVGDKIKRWLLDQREIISRGHSVRSYREWGRLADPAADAIPQTKAAEKQLRRRIMGY